MPPPLTACPKILILSLLLVALVLHHIFLWEAGVGRIGGVGPEWMSSFWERRLRLQKLGLVGEIKSRDHFL